MNKKEYQKPAMRVVLIQQHAQLLAGSATVGATMDGTWEEEDI